MSEQAVTLHQSAEIVAFDEAMNLAGFRTTAAGSLATEWRWRGQLPRSRVDTEITLPAEYPYGSPRVVLPSYPRGTSWHRGHDGTLCLWGTYAKGDLPWLSVPNLLARADEWVETDRSGWSDDDPALDLEAYHAPRLIEDSATVPMLVIEDWDTIAGRWFRATGPGEYGQMVVDEVYHNQPAAIPAGRGPGRKRRRKARHLLTGLAVDLGALERPIISIDQLVNAVGAESGGARQVLGSGQPLLLACRYERLGAVGLIGFWLTASQHEFIYLTDRAASQRLRVGWHAERLADRTVSVIGAGSVGGFLADMLRRSGVKSLTLHDNDTLQPGNLPRHLASARFVGAPKTLAVRETMKLQDEVSVPEGGPAIRSLEQAVDLLNTRDLVIDCTGDRLTFQLLITASEIAKSRFLHVAVEGHGQYARVDICPPFEEADPLPADGVLPVALDAQEGGCGDPISPTPPSASFETAAIGARIAINILAGERVEPAGERRRLFRAPS
jgi:molybdopterin/thiamine biosynthesis adenylyltransferase